MVEEGLDYGRRLTWVAEFLRELSDTDREVLVLYAWGELDATPRSRRRSASRSAPSAPAWPAADGSGNCSRRTAKYRVGAANLPDDED